MDPEKLKAIAANLDLDGDTLSRLNAITAAAPTDENAPSTNDTPASHAKSGIGISQLPVRVMKYEQKQGQYGPITNYELMLYKAFAKNDIPPNEGELISENELHLRIHTNRKFTDEEIKEHKARCATEGITDKYEVDRKKELDYLENGIESVRPGRILKVCHFGAAFKKMADLDFEPGDSVFVRNFFAEQQLDTHDEVIDELTPEQIADGVKLLIHHYNGNVERVMATEEERAKGLKRLIIRTITINKYGVKFYSNSMLADKTAADQSEEEIWGQLARHNAIPNFRPEAGYGPQNQTEEERKFEENLGARNNQLDKWKATFSKVQPANRGLVQAPLVVGLYRPDDGPEPYQLVDSHAVHIPNPKWSPVWTDSKRNPDGSTDTWKCGSFGVDADIFQAGKAGEKARISVTMNPTETQRKDKQEVMNEFGCSNVKRFANIAPTLVPLCSGISVCKLHLIDSAHMVEVSPEMNPQAADGQYVEGVSHGATYSGQILKPNVASGVARGGLRVNRQCAEAAFKRVFGVFPSRDKPPALVVSYAGKNKLNLKHTTDVLNTFECPCNFEALENEGWVFYFVCKTSKQTSVAQRFLYMIETNAEGDRDQMTQVVSDVIMDKNSHDAAYFAFPADINQDASEYCIFAVKRSVADEFEKPVQKRSEEAFLNEVVDLIAKRHATSAAEQPNKKRQKRQKPAVDHIVLPAPPPTPQVIIASDPLSDSEAFDPVAMMTDD